VRVWLALFVCLPVLFLPALAQAQMRFAIADYAPDAPVAGDVTIGAFSFEEDRMRFALTVDLPDLWKTLDDLAAARGNLTGSDLEFYWLGPTTVKSVEDAALTLMSRGRLQTTLSATVFGQTLTETLRDTRGFDVRLTPHWDGQSKTLSLGTELLDVHDVPLWAKDIVRQIGVPLRTDIPLFSATSEDLEALDLDLRDIAITGAGQGAQLGAQVSMSAQAGRQAVMQRLYRK